ncbi:hypothetical protein C2I36_09590 [Rhodobacteraceae bacterium WD3A24]|nr:hypothetical protein C2I36_09590 [Rhodobacteraceae bacterium WD3A24]
MPGMSEKSGLGRSIDQRLARFIRAAEAEGKTVLRASVRKDGGIDLTFAPPGSGDPSDEFDLVDFSR